MAAYVSVLAGFSLFLAIEQFLHWHHCHRETADCHPPLGYLILVGDALHNLLGGLAVGAAFVVDVRVGLTIWLAAAAHEVPQELGDFGVLVHGGWSRRPGAGFEPAVVLDVPARAASSAWAVSTRFDTSWLLGFAAGNFLYIGASDLVPGGEPPARPADGSAPLPRLRGRRRAARRPEARGSEH